MESNHFKGTGPPGNEDNVLNGCRVRACRQMQAWPFGPSSGSVSPGQRGVPIHSPGACGLPLIKSSKRATEPAERTCLPQARPYRGQGGQCGARLCHETSRRIKSQENKESKNFPL